MAFQIKAKFQTRRLLAFTDRAKKNLVFSAEQGINETAKLIQTKMRDSLKRKFTLRKDKFLRRQAAIIKPFASVKKGALFATISVGQRPRLLLSLLERGGLRQPAKGKGVIVAVPITGSPARPSKGSSVPQEFLFKSLRLKKRKNKKTGQARFAGQRNTFTIPGVGVFQKGNDGGNELLYLYATRPIKLRPQLGFLALAKRIGQKDLSRLIASKFKKTTRR